MDTNTTMAGPVHLRLPDEEPRPEAGCEVCAALAEERAAARTAGDLAKVTDCNVRMRRHPHAAAKES
ncbi:hypothetical protein [Streptomyces sp. NPDC003077]|uniref:hypothetical protein n=1 Tax=Streptomyces sp. NPDC003077 TaxID=3154443 RepID=UPI0033BD72AB